MNKRCTNPSCRKTFSTLNFGGQCPFCGKTYQNLKSGRKNALPVLADPGRDRMLLKIIPENPGRRISVLVQTENIMNQMREGKKIMAVKAFREEMVKHGFMLGLKESKDFVESAAARRPILFWRLTGNSRNGLREIKPASEDKRAEKRKKAEALAMTIEDLDLNVRAYNCLNRAGIKTVRDLTALSEEDLRNVRNIGMKSMEKIKSVLSALGLNLRPAGSRGRKRDAAGNVTKRGAGEKTNPSGTPADEDFLSPDDAPDFLIR